MNHLPNRPPLNQRSLKQRTIREAVYGIGIGVHSGEKVRLAMRPSGPDSGIHFLRTVTEQHGLTERRKYEPLLHGCSIRQ